MCLQTLSAVPTETFCKSARSNSLKRENLVKRPRRGKQKEQKERGRGIAKTAFFVLRIVRSSAGRKKGTAQRSVLLVIIKPGNKQRQRWLPPSNVARVVSWGRIKKVAVM